MFVDVAGMRFLPECRETIRAGALVAVSISGGKDCRAMAILLSRIVPRAPHTAKVTTYRGPSTDFTTSQIPRSSIHQSNFEPGSWFVVCPSRTAPAPVRCFAHRRYRRDYAFRLLLDASAITRLVRRTEARPARVEWA